MIAELLSGRSAHRTLVRRLLTAQMQEVYTKPNANLRQRFTWNPGWEFIDCTKSKHKPETGRQSQKEAHTEHKHAKTHTEHWLAGSCHSRGTSTSKRKQETGRQSQAEAHTEHRQAETHTDHWLAGS